MIQRIFDFVLAILLLILLLPLMLVISLFLLIINGRPILFKQQRAGWHAKSFTLYKFRTMHNYTLAPGQLASIASITTMGYWLRKFSLDELPQLWNIILGDLSFVGPRPLLLEYLPLYNKEQLRRHNVRPGLTGWAQINGRNSLSWEQRLALDIWYVDNYSFLLNLKILILTPYQVLTAKGVDYQEQDIIHKFTDHS